MIEQGGALATWRFVCLFDDICLANDVSCEKIGDHRPAYLTYEGPISGNRGQVTAADRGSCEVLSGGLTRWELHLAGSRLAGRFELVRRGPASDQWVFRRLATGH